MCKILLVHLRLKFYLVLSALSGVHRIADQPVDIALCQLFDSRKRFLIIPIWLQDFIKQAYVTTTYVDCMAAKMRGHEVCNVRTIFTLQGEFCIWSGIVSGDMEVSVQFSRFLSQGCHPQVDGCILHKTCHGNLMFLVTYYFRAQSYFNPMSKW